MNENLFLRKKIQNLIKEMFEQSEEVQEPIFDKEKAKEVTIAFINKELEKGSVRVEESKKMEVSDMVDANDYMRKGYAFKTENPIIFFKYKGKEYSFVLEIEKEYSYQTERGDWDNPPYESSELIKVSLTHYEIEIGDEDGEIVKLTPADLGKETFKKFEKTLLEIIE
jgi:hypothetical protein